MAHLQVQSNLSIHFLWVKLCCPSTSMCPSSLHPCTLVQAPNKNLAAAVSSEEGVKMQWWPGLPDDDTSALNDDMMQPLTAGFGFKMGQEVPSCCAGEDQRQYTIRNPQHTPPCQSPKVSLCLFQYCNVSTFRRSGHRQSLPLARKCPAQSSRQAMHVLFSIRQANCAQKTFKPSSVRMQMHEGCRKSNRSEF